MKNKELVIDTRKVIIFISILGIIASVGLLIESIINDGNVAVCLLFAISNVSLLINQKFLKAKPVTK